MKKKFLLEAVLILGLLACLANPRAAVRADSSSTLPQLSEFVAAVANSQSDVVKGVYVPGVLADPVIQQPPEYPGYVSVVDGTLTQFSMAAQYGTLGFLAHNSLAGAAFPALGPGQKVWVVYGDGHLAQYVITEIDSYQALQPDSPTSDFMDLASGVTYTVSDVFTKYYTGGDHVIFQTCIEQEGNSSWGRLFVVAQPAAAVAQSFGWTEGISWK